MSEKEKRIVEKLKDAIPNMSEFDKGYILGKTESFSEKKDDSDQEQKKVHKVSPIKPYTRRKP